MDAPGLALELFALRTIAKGGGRPLRGWKSCRLYERFVEEGYVREVPDENAFFRRFELTDEGREVLMRHGQEEVEK